MASATIRSELNQLKPESFEREEKIQQWSVRRQYYSTIFMDLLAFSFGATCGWTSSSIPILRSDETPLSYPISLSEGSWIASFMCLGGFLGNLIIGWLATKIGPKRSLCILALPQISGWLIIYYAKNPLHLIISRFMSGFAGGGLYAVIPSYISEIADDRVRGTLGSTVVFSCNLGIFFAYVCGEYVEYLTFPWLMAPISLVFLGFFISIPDSPTFYARRQLYEEAEKSLFFFRNIRNHDKYGRQHVSDELQKLHNPSGDENKSLSTADFKTKHARKAIIYGIALMFLNQFCGVFAMINFTSTIFQEAGSNLRPNISAIIVGAIQIIGSLLPALLVDKLGRRALMATSAFGTSVGLATLGMYSLLKDQGLNMENFSWVPLFTFSFIIFIANCGVLTLPFMIISEICHPKIRGFVTVLCMSFLWILGFITIKCLPLFIEVFDMHGTMFVFACNSLIGALFIVFNLPETKGKSFDEIIECLEG